LLLYGDVVSHAFFFPKEEKAVWLRKTNGDVEGDAIMAGIKKV